MAWQYHGSRSKTGKSADPFAGAGDKRAIFLSFIFLSVIFLSVVFEGFDRRVDTDYETD
jgi:hypothetical protein